ncbi:MAG: acylphosphatase [Phycisphaerae bacterium]
MTSKHIIFTGTVQGVGFRFTAHSIAKRCGLCGFVRNLSDGSVEMLAQGDDQDINDCIRDLNETFRGSIRDTNINDATCDEKLTDFRITF